MITLKIAELLIGAEGFDTPLFHTRTKEYQFQPHSDPQLYVVCDACDEITVPEGQLIACGKERHWVRQKNGYAFYDSVLLDGRETVIASVEANEDWSVVKAYLKDVTPWGGPPLDVRNFNLLGEAFRWFILFHEGMILHASCVKSEGKAVAFSAPSGTGKSTHTSLWRQYFNTEMINDDSPAIRFLNDTFLAFGTPWSGKTDINHNIFAPLATLVFLEQAKENQLSQLAGKEACFRLLRELMRPVYPELLQKTLHFLELMIEHVPSYLLQCTISEEAAQLSHSLLGREEG